VDRISLSSSPIQYLDVYGNFNEQTFYLFDSTTQSYKGSYAIFGMPPQTGFDSLVENWNPTAPPASVFTPPSVCYAPPDSSTPVDPQAPNFPQAFTMVTEDFVLYYNGPDQWRSDSSGGITLQTNKKTYVWSSDPLNSILPTPCVIYDPGSGIPRLIPGSPFTKNLGTATVNGRAASIWSTTPTQDGSVWIWYLDENNLPLYQLGSDNRVLTFQLGPPPSYLFVPPTPCFKL
jgi:hypothetical protein